EGGGRGGGGVGGVGERGGGGGGRRGSVGIEEMIGRRDEREHEQERRDDERGHAIAIEKERGAREHPRRKRQEAQQVGERGHERASLRRGVVQVERKRVDGEPR